MPFKARVTLDFEGTRYEIVGDFIKLAALKIEEV